MALLKTSFNSILFIVVPKENKELSYDTEGIKMYIKKTGELIEKFKKNASVKSRLCTFKIPENCYAKELSNDLSNEIEKFSKTILAIDSLRSTDTIKIESDIHAQSNIAMNEASKENYDKWEITIIAEKETIEELLKLIEATPENEKKDLADYDYFLFERAENTYGEIAL
ncbi:MAG: hypothetical protein WC089_04250 [Candidatus Paceibacterota bacterium]